MASPSYRPLSPHLQVYRWTITMFMSIVQRATGIALYLGTGLLMLWLVAAAIGGAPLNAMGWLLGSWVGHVILFGLSWSLLAHLLGGIKHFIWDSGRGLEPGQREGIAWGVLLGSLVLTALVWALYVWVR